MRSDLKYEIYLACKNKKKLFYVHFVSVESTILRPQFCDAQQRYTYCQIFVLGGLIIQERGEITQLCERVIFKRLLFIRIFSTLLRKHYIWIICYQYALSEYYLHFGNARSLHHTCYFFFVSLPLGTIIQCLLNSGFGARGKIRANSDAFIKKYFDT